MKKEESITDLGTINIHKNAISSIASIAALDVEGVKGIGRNLKSNILELLGKKDFQLAGIKVDIDKNSEVKIEIPLVVKYGFNIPEISGKVQDNISLAVEKMTSLTIRDININIVGIEKGEL
jgi:uncharacterized alkaline shock family protein YloU